MKQIALTLLFASVLALGLGCAQEGGTQGQETMPGDYQTAPGDRDSTGTTGSTAGSTAGGATSGATSGSMGGNTTAGATTAGGTTGGTTGP